MTERQDEDERRVDLQVDKNSFAVSTLIYASSVPPLSFCRRPFFAVPPAC